MKKEENRSIQLKIGPSGTKIKQPTASNPRQRGGNLTLLAIPMEKEHL